MSIESGESLAKNLSLKLINGMWRFTVTFTKLTAKALIYATYKLTELLTKILSRSSSALGRALYSQALERHGIRVAKLRKLHPGEGLASLTIDRSQAHALARAVRKLGVDFSLTHMENGETVMQYSARDAETIQVATKVIRDLTTQTTLQRETAEALDQPTRLTPEKASAIEGMKTIATRENTPAPALTATLAAKTTMHDNGLIASKEWHNAEGQLHREDGPAAVYWNENGTLTSREWRQNGQLHREGGPAQITTYPDGAPKAEMWLNNGQLHREDGPALIRYSPDGTVTSSQFYTHGTQVDSLDQARPIPPAYPLTTRTITTADTTRNITVPSANQIATWQRDMSESHDLPGLREWRLDATSAQATGSPTYIAQSEGAQPTQFQRVMWTNETGQTTRSDGLTEASYDATGNLQGVGYQHENAPQTRLGSSDVPLSDYYQFDEQGRQTTTWQAGQDDAYTVRHYNNEGQLSNPTPDTPAVSTWTTRGSDDQPQRVEWRNNGVLHRNGEPAIIERSANQTRVSYYEQGQLHREDGPALAVYPGPAETTQPTIAEYYTHGHKQNPPTQDTPARTTAPLTLDELVETYGGASIDYARTELTGSADAEFILPDGTSIHTIFDTDTRQILEITYFNDDDEIHRADGPAHTTFYPDGATRIEEWMVNDELHREDGPAFVAYAPDGSVTDSVLYRDGVEITTEPPVEHIEADRNQQVLDLPTQPTPVMTNPPLEEQPLQQEEPHPEINPEPVPESRASMPVEQPAPHRDEPIEHTQPRQPLSETPNGPTRPAPAPPAQNDGAFTTPPVPSDAQMRTDLAQDQNGNWTWKGTSLPQPHEAHAPNSTIYIWDERDNIDPAIKNEVPLYVTVAPPTSQSSLPDQRAYVWGGEQSKRADGLTKVTYHPNGSPAEATWQNKPNTSTQLRAAYWHPGENGEAPQVGVWSGVVDGSPQTKYFNADGSERSTSPKVNGPDQMRASLDHQFAKDQVANLRASQDAPALSHSGPTR